MEVCRIRRFDASDGLDHVEGIAQTKDELGMEIGRGGAGWKASLRYRVPKVSPNGCRKVSEQPIVTNACPDIDIHYILYIADFARVHSISLSHAWNGLSAFFHESFFYASYSNRNNYPILITEHALDEHPIQMDFFLDFREGHIAHLSVPAVSHSPTINESNKYFICYPQHAALWLDADVHVHRTRHGTVGDCRSPRPSCRGRCRNAHQEALHAPNLRL